MISFDILADTKNVVIYNKVIVINNNVEVRIPSSFKFQLSSPNSFSTPGAPYQMYFPKTKVVQTKTQQ